MAVSDSRAGNAEKASATGTPGTRFTPAREGNGEKSTPEVLVVVNGRHVHSLRRQLCTLPTAQVKVIGSSTRIGTRDSTIVLEVVLVVLDYYR